MNSPLPKSSPKSLSYASALHPRPMRELFPPITPYSQGFLSVDDTHTIYWEQSGNPDGVPVVILHGGPGAGASAAHRRFFDPDHYRIIIFDQRGAGRSHPLGSLTNNTLQNIIDDTEKLRLHLKIDRWHLFGGSWGSTVALAYAQNHPHHCISLTLRSIFLMEQYEINWFMTGMATIFPEAWDSFSEGKNPSDLLKSYYEDLTGTNDRAAIEAALRWNAYESTCASFFPQKETLVSDDQRFYALAMAKIEAHYFHTQIITPDNSLLKHIRKIRSIPATIIQGRYDMICPIASANRLHLAWPEADYIIVPDAGHSFLDPTLRTRLIETTESHKSLK